MSLFLFRLGGDGEWNKHASYPDRKPQINPWLLQNLLQQKDPFSSFLPYSWFSSKMAFVSPMFGSLPASNIPPWEPLDSMGGSQGGHDWDPWPQTLCWTRYASKGWWLFALSLQQPRNRFPFSFPSEDFLSKSIPKKHPIGSQYEKIVGGFNPSEKIFVKLDHFSELGLGWKITYVKPPPKWNYSVGVGEYPTYSLWLNPRANEVVKLTV